MSDQQAASQASPTNESRHPSAMACNGLCDLYLDREILTACPPQGFLPHAAFQHDRIAVEKVVLCPLHRTGQADFMMFS